MSRIRGEGAGEPGKEGNKGKGKGEGQAAVPGGLARLWHIFTSTKPPAPKAFSLGQRTPPRAPVPQSLKNQKPKPDISPDLQSNLDKLKAVFNYPVNSDVQFREFVVSTSPPTKAFVVYIEGLADKNIETETILKPLMVFARDNPNLNRRELLSGLRGRLIPGTQVTELHSCQEVLDSILTGTSALFMDGADFALDVETKGWEHRGVERPLTEITVRGPQDSFTETLRANTALVRRRIRSPRLTMESLKVGKLSATDVVIAYIDGITNPKLIAEVRRRISSLETDFLPAADVLEQYIQDSPRSLFPQTGSTERPDRVAAFLSEGNVAIMVDNSPYALVVPVFFTNFIHSPEDYYLRWPYGTFMRVVRLIGAGVSIFLPALYLALANYHQEMIPTSLLFAIAASREAVPFPVIGEIILMEVSFELVREAGERIPSVIGPTIGIVGAIILGQAAVAANIVSPILVIIQALTILGGFAVPNYPASWTVRLLRLFFIGAAFMAGFVGISWGVFILGIHLVSMKTFGVPYMSPVAPYTSGNPDIIYRAPVFSMEKRPIFLRTLELIRQPRIVRKWDLPDSGDPKETDSAKVNGKGGAQ